MQNDVNQDKVESIYNTNLHVNQLFLDRLKNELTQVCRDNNIALGFKIEGRIKSLTSIEDKILRNKLQSIDEVFDVIGLRIICLWERDVHKLHDLLKKELKVTWETNTFERLDDNQFGYQSRHYQVEFNNNWLQSPTTKFFKNISAELQIRTIAQHLWATASHELQYKIEKEVPSEIKRSINRVSALLETIDLEFERVLSEKDIYSKKALHDSEKNITKFLNLPINASTLEEYSKYKYPNLDISKYWQNALLHDLNKEKYKYLKDLDIIIDAAKEVIDIHSKEYPSFYNHSTSYITKSLAVVDPEFRNTHGFSKITLEALERIIKNFPTIVRTLSDIL